MRYTMPLQQAPGDLLNTAVETSVVYPQRYITDSNGDPIDPIESTGSRVITTGGGATGGTSQSNTTLSFEITTPDILWDIKHDLGRYPSVTVTTAGGVVVQPDIEYVSANEILITFAFPFAGFVYLN